MTKSNSLIKFPYYKGHIKLTHAEGLVSLEQFIRAHKNPIQETRLLIEQIKKASELNDLKAKRILKQNLFTFTPAVKIEVGFGRKYANIVGWTGLMQLDFDKIETTAKAHDLKEYLFTTYQCVICSYMSPSGKGVKALIRTTVPRNIEHYRAIYKTIQKEFESISYFDTATKNAVLPLFLSYDEDIYYRDYDETVAWDLEDWIEEKKCNMSNQPPTSFSKQNQDSSEAQYYYDKCIRIFTEKMYSISDNGHPQLRSACLILGSRAGAGYISLNEAMLLAENAVCSNSYFDKDRRGYIDTSVWAVKEGYKSPKYYG